LHLHIIDIAIIIVYLLSTVLVGYWVSKRASRDMKAYFLGGNTMPWYILGISNASGMFDISGRAFGYLGSGLRSTRSSSWFIFPRGCGGQTP
jgi:Na+/proline symporter